MTARPEPVEAYLLCELPVGTRYRIADEANAIIYQQDGTRAARAFVQVVEWPQRTYDGIPADDLDLLARYGVGAGLGRIREAVARIRAAIEAQEQNQ